MGITRAVWRLMKTAALCGAVGYVAVSLAMLAWTFAWVQADADDIQPAEVIMCLGGGMSPDGVLDPATKGRVERCVQLHAAGLAPVVVFTGGTARPQGPSAAAQMARLAQSLGLPQQVIVLEELSQSTLQNALFSFDLTPNADRFIIVTEAFHLPRSWASFRWAAYELGIDQPDLTLDMSDNVRQAANGTE